MRNQFEDRTIILERGPGYLLVIGAVIAGNIGWDRTHSIGWTFIDAFLSWFYVIWHVLFH